MSGQDDRLVRRAVDAAARRPAAGPCPDAEALGLYAERLLDADEQQAMDGHVAECARCQASLAAFVRGAPEAEVAAAADGIGVSARPGGLDGGEPWWRGWKWLVPVAATAAVAIVAVWVQRPAAPELTMSSAEQQATATGAAPAGAAARPGTAAPAQPAAAAPTAAPGAAGRENTRARAQDSAPPPPAAPSVPAVPAVPAPSDASRGAVVAESREAPAERQRIAGTAAAEPESTAKPAAERLAAAPAASPPPAPAAVAQAPAAPAPPAMADTANAAPRAKALARADAAAPEEAASSVAGRAEAAQFGSRRMTALTGRVSYRVRRALPAGAVIDVRLLDVSRADAPADVIGRVEIVTRGEQVPVPFTLPYDASRIDPQRRYTVQVTITVDGAVAFRTTTAHTVLTSGAPSTNVEIVVELQR